MAALAEAQYREEVFLFGDNVANAQVDGAEGSELLSAGGDPCKRMVVSAEHSTIFSCHPKGGITITILDDEFKLGKDQTIRGGVRVLEEELFFSLEISTDRQLLSCLSKKSIAVWKISELIRDSQSAKPWRSSSTSGAFAQSVGGQTIAILSEDGKVSVMDLGQASGELKEAGQAPPGAHSIAQLERQGGGWAICLASDKGIVTLDTKSQHLAPLQLDFGDDHAEGKIKGIISHSPDQLIVFLAQLEGEEAWIELIAVDNVFSGARMAVVAQPEVERADNLPASLNPGFVVLPELGKGGYLTLCNRSMSFSICRKAESGEWTILAGDEDNFPPQVPHFHRVANVSKKEEFIIGAGLLVKPPGTAIWTSQRSNLEKTPEKLGIELKGLEVVSVSEPTSLNLNLYAGATLTGLEICSPDVQGQEATVFRGEEMRKKLKDLEGENYQIEFKSSNIVLVTLSHTGSLGFMKLSSNAGDMPEIAEGVSAIAKSEDAIAKDEGFGTFNQEDNGFSSKGFETFNQEDNGFGSNGDGAKNGEFGGSSFEWSGDTKNEDSTAFETEDNGFGSMGSSNDNKNDGIGESAMSSTDQKDGFSNNFYPEDNGFSKSDGNIAKNEDTGESKIECKPKPPRGRKTQDLKFAGEAKSKEFYEFVFNRIGTILEKLEEYRMDFDPKGLHKLQKEVQTNTKLIGDLDRETKKSESKMDEALQVEQAIKSLELDANISLKKVEKHSDKKCASRIGRIFEEQIKEVKKKKQKSKKRRKDHEKKLSDIENEIKELEGKKLKIIRRIEKCDREEKECDAKIKGLERKRDEKTSKEVDAPLDAITEAKRRTRVQMVQDVTIGIARLQGKLRDAYKEAATPSHPLRNIGRVLNMQSRRLDTAYAKLSEIRERRVRAKRESKALTIHSKSGDPTNVHRSRHASIVWEEAIYVVGGIQKEKFLESVIRMRVTDAFPLWEPLEKMRTRRADFGTRVVDGILYVVGGRNEGGVLNSVECLDLGSVSDGWRECPPLRKRRASMSLSACNDKLYVVGGEDSSKHLVPDIECLDLKNKEIGWLKDPSLGWQLMSKDSVAESRESREATRWKSEVSAEQWGAQDFIAKLRSKVREEADRTESYLAVQESTEPAHEYIAASLRSPEVKLKRIEQKLPSFEGSFKLPAVESNDGDMDEIFEPNSEFSNPNPPRDNETSEQINDFGNFGFDKETSNAGGESGADPEPTDSNPEFSFAFDSGETSASSEAKKKGDSENVAKAEEGKTESKNSESEPDAFSLGSGFSKGESVTKSLSFSSLPDEESKQKSKETEGISFGVFDETPKDKTKETETETESGSFGAFNETSKEGKSSWGDDSASTENKTKEATPGFSETSFTTESAFKVEDSGGDSAADSGFQSQSAGDGFSGQNFMGVGDQNASGSSTGFGEPKSEFNSDTSTAFDSGNASAFGELKSEFSSNAFSGSDGQNQSSWGNPSQGNMASSSSNGFGGGNGSGDSGMAAAMGVGFGSTFGSSNDDFTSGIGDQSSFGGGSGGFGAGDSNTFGQSTSIGGGAGFSSFSGDNSSNGAFGGNSGSFSAGQGMSDSNSGSGFGSFSDGGNSNSFGALAGSGNDNAFGGSSGGFNSNNSGGFSSGGGWGANGGFDSGSSGFGDGFSGSSGGGDDAFSQFRGSAD